MTTNYVAKLMRVWSAAKGCGEKSTLNYCEFVSYMIEQVIACCFILLTKAYKGADFFAAEYAVFVRSISHHAKAQHHTETASVYSEIARALPPEPHARARALWKVARLKHQIDLFSREYVQLVGM